MAEELTYTKAIAELEGILEAIEEEQVNVDELAAKVKRSAELIRFCRKRIESATMEVESVVREIETGEETDE